MLRHLTELVAHRSQALAWIMIGNDVRFLPQRHREFLRTFLFVLRCLIGASNGHTRLLELLLNLAGVEIEQ